MAPAHVANLKRLAPDVTMFDVTVNVVFKGRILFWYVHKVVFSEHCCLKTRHHTCKHLEYEVRSSNCKSSTPPPPPPLNPPQPKKELDIKEFH